nr:unnamed protein product [Digitaria exilis]
MTATYQIPPRLSSGLASGPGKGGAHPADNPHSISLPPKPPTPSSIADHHRRPRVLLQVRARRFYALSSDDEDTWATVKEEEELFAQHERPMFNASTVVSHDSVLTFVDAHHALLLQFNPVDDSATRIIEFPSPTRDIDSFVLDELNGEEAAEHRVAFSQGSLCVITVSREGQIRLFCEELGEDKWSKVLQVASDEIYCCDTSLAGCHACAELVALDPTDRCTLVFAMPEANAAFTVLVDPSKCFSPGRVRLIKFANINLNTSSLDAVVWKFNPAAPAVQDGEAKRIRRRGRTLSRKGLFGMARNAFNLARKHIDQVQPLADVAGTVAEAAGVPFASKLAPAVKGLIAANKAVHIGDEFRHWLTKASPLEKKMIGNAQEADEVIDYWIKSGDYFRVTPAPGMSDQEQLKLRELFRRRGAEELLLSPPRPPPPDEEEAAPSQACPTPTPATHYNPTQIETRTERESEKRGEGNGLPARSPTEMYPAAATLSPRAVVPIPKLSKFRAGGRNERLFLAWADFGPAHANPGRNERGLSMELTICTRPLFIAIHRGNKLMARKLIRQTDISKVRFFVLEMAAKPTQNAVDLSDELPDVCVEQMLHLAFAHGDDIKC